MKPKWILKIIDRIWYTPFSYRDHQGVKQICRLAPEKLEIFYDDPITQACGASGEFVNDWRKRDLRAGCPYCRAAVMENASEPDVLNRWGLGRWGG